MEHGLDLSCQAHISLANCVDFNWIKKKKYAKTHTISEPNELNLEAEVLNLNNGVMMIALKIIVQNKTDEMKSCAVFCEIDAE